MTKSKHWVGAIPTTPKHNKKVALYNVISDDTKSDGWVTVKPMWLTQAEVTMRVLAGDYVELVQVHSSGRRP